MLGLVFKSPVQKKTEKPATGLNCNRFEPDRGCSPSPLVSGPVADPWFLSEIKD